MFTSSVPATAGAFFDRTREREQIHRAIDHLLSGAPRWLCIVGPRKVGKTSLLLEASREAREGRAASRASPPHFVVVDVLDTWEWAIAAVGVGGAVALLDRTKAKRGAAITLGATASIENLLAWLDEGRASRARTARPTSRAARGAPARTPPRGRP